MTHEPFPHWLRLSLSCSCLGVIVTDAEVLSLGRHLRDRGLLSPRNKRSPRRVSWWSKNDAILTYACITVRIGSCLLLLGGISTAVYITTAVTLALQRRRYTGRNGADSIFTIVFLCASASLILDSVTINNILAFFLAGLLALIYITSALAKVSGVHWRDGMALRLLFSTGTFGRAWINSMLQSRPNLSAWISTTTIGSEFLFAVGAVVPPRISIALLTLASLFHVATALIMGLNTFVLGMVALFPAAYRVSSLLYTR